VPRLEIHPLSEFRGQAARLLAERYRAQRAAEPLLPEVTDFHAHVPEEGQVATRGAEAVAYLAGTVDDEQRMARWQFAGHAATEPEALRDLFAVQAAAFGVSRFMVTVPATDRALIETWFSLAFGCQAVWAVREVEPFDAPFAGEVRPVEAGDVGAIADLDRILYDHQRESPSFSEFAAPPRDQLEREAVELVEEGPTRHPSFVAELDGRVVGLLVLHHRPTGDLRVPEHNIDLAFAATRDDVRGSGAGLALTAHAMRWAHDQGFRSMTVDWRSVNLLSSRFWPRRGFRPQYLRLYRAIP
jgi:GNAT superfamily N-acetyltransferase